MPVWSVSEPYVSLWLHDEPLGYQPAQGPRISFDLAFKQRDYNTGVTPNIFSVGNRWNFSWFSDVTRSGGANTVHFPDGRLRTFQGTNDYLTTSPATNVTVNTSNAVLYADATFAATNFALANGNNTFTAIAKDSYGRKDTNSITVNLPATNSYGYDFNGK
jgi:hypothetical protein